MRQSRIKYSSFWGRCWWHIKSALSPGVMSDSDVRLMAIKFNDIMLDAGWSCNVYTPTQIPIKSAQVMDADERALSIRKGHIHFAVLYMSVGSWPETIWFRVEKKRARLGALSVGSVFYWNDFSTSSYGAHVYTICSDIYNMDTVIDWMCVKHGQEQAGTLVMSLDLSVGLGPKSLQ